MAMIVIAGHDERAGLDLAQRPLRCRDERVQDLEQCPRVAA
jgi:hypothetical protein